jgi:hypothetical protein
MPKIKEPRLTRDEQQFPSRILYSSPPEVSGLSAWVREIESKRNGGDSTSKTRSRAVRSGESRRS